MQYSRAGGLRAENVEADVKEKVHVNREEALVEGDRFQMKKNFDNLGAPDPDIACLFDYFMLIRGKIDPQVFEVFL